ncbi:MAG: 5-oxoprolinase subunit PxpB [Ectobacillus sp.]
MNYTLHPLADNAVIVQFGEYIEEQVYERVQAFSKYLEHQPLPWMVEYIPAFTTVTLFYDPMFYYRHASPYEVVCHNLESILQTLENTQAQEKKIVEIPVCYGGEFGPDLEFVARHNKLSPQQVIDIHQNGTYLVYMIGFAPGFPYMGGMDERIAAPRKQSPSLAIPAGSVGIAGKQTGIYPIETPGGWQIIGKTPLPLFRPDHKNPSLLQAGDEIRFVSITPQQFQTIKEAGTWH